MKVFKNISAIDVGTVTGFFLLLVLLTELELCVKSIHGLICVIPTEWIVDLEKLIGSAIDNFVLTLFTRLHVFAHEIDLTRQLLNSLFLCLKVLPELFRY